MGPSAMYNHLVTQTQDESGAADAATDTRSVRDIVCRVLDVPVDDLSPEVPLTSYGLDSLSAANLSYSLASLVKISQIQLLADMTVKQLEERVELAKEAKANEGAKTDMDEPQCAKPNVLRVVDERAMKIHEMLAVVNRYSQFDDAAKAPRPPVGSGEKIVVLTGTTGSLGSHVLHLLLRDTSLKKVYALYRKKDGDASVLDRQRAAFDLRALVNDASDMEKLVTLEADLGAENMGLQQGDYDEVRIFS